MNKALRGGAGVEDWVNTINAQLRTFQLPFVCGQPTPGDGNCFFHAIVDQLQRQDVKQSIIGDPQQYTHLTLRASVVNFMETNAEFNNDEMIQMQKMVLIQDTQRPGETEENTWLRYLSSMKLLGTWADSLAILATALFLQKNIFLTSCEQREKDPWNAILCKNDQGALH